MDIAKERISDLEHQIQEAAEQDDGEDKEAEELGEAECNRR